MTRLKTAALFPGQGAFVPGVLSALKGKRPEVDEVFAAVDAAARDVLGRDVSSVVFGDNPPSIETLLAGPADLLQPAIYGVSVAVYRILAAEGFSPAVMMGHSFGEVAALVCGGAFTVEQGAEIVCRRVAALERRGDRGGYMAALSVDGGKAGKLVEALGADRLAVAAENHPGQTVLSGASERMDVVRDLAPLLQSSFVRLNSPYPFHSPLMAPVVKAFAESIKHIKAAPLRVPVYSPILGRRYAAADDAAACLAEHMVLRVRYADGVRTLHGEGVRAFVECGALDALSKLAKKVLNDPAVVTVAALDRAKGEESSLKDALAALEGGSPEGPPLAGAILPGADAAAFERFWRERGDAVRVFAREEFNRFSGAASPGRAPAPAVLPPPAQVLGGRVALFGEIAGLYAAALEYPQDVFTEAAGLESDLGVDSVKQTELVARLMEKYGLVREEGFRLGQYDTLGKIVDYVAARRGDAAAPAVAGPASTAPAAAPAPVSGGRAALFGEIADLYAAALEYPKDVFTEAAGLESELGVDSVKQTELVARLMEKYGLVREEGFRLGQYDTLGKIVDYVSLRRRGAPALAAAR